MPPKQNDATATEKALGLYTLLLLSRRQWSLSELATHFCCSKSTMLRHLNHIERFKGSELCVERRAEGGRLQSWYWLKSRHEAVQRRMMLSVDEMRLLQLCRDLAAPFLPADLGDALGDAVRRVSVLLPPDAPLTETPQPMVQPALLGVIDYAPQREILHTLLRAIEQRFVCDVVYAVPGREARTHEMAVTRLVSGSRALYAHGWKVADRGRAEGVHPLFLAVHRIRAVMPTQRTHALTTPPEERGFGIMDGAPFAVRVRIAPEAANYVRDRVFGPEQTLQEASDGGVILSFLARSEAELLSWVLSFGRRACVLDPPAFAQKVRDEARAVADAADAIRCAAFSS